MVYKVPFFFRLYQEKEEDKQILDKEMKKSVCHLDILKGFQHTPVQLC